MSVFRVGDAVKTKYAGASGVDDGTWHGEVTAIADNGDVSVRHPHEVIEHIPEALELVASAESLFIPDEKFAAEVRRSRSGGSPWTSCESVMTTRIQGGVSDRDRMGATVTVWSWVAKGMPDGRKIGQLAREAVNASRGPRREKLSRLHNEVFKSEHAGVAWRTVYQVVEA